MSEHVITTMSGARFDYDKPAATAIKVDDLAVALGNTCRFGGHTRYFYSVAEHAILVYRLVVYAGFDAYVALAALHHDSHEAFTGDVPSPMKDKIKSEAPGLWEKMERDIDVAIASVLQLSPTLFKHDAVKAGDKLALAYEASILKPEGTPIYGLESMDVRGERAIADRYIVGWPPEQAAVEFLRTHFEAVRDASFLP